MVVKHLQTGIRSWGGTIRSEHAVLRPVEQDVAAAAVAGASYGSTLAFGCGRSYGDVALNPGRTLIDCRSLDQFISFDRQTGVLTCEAGVRLADILAVICRPEADGSGWFLPVTPGTRFVTLGGAIANDVHGKNHHQYGSIGRHLVSLEVARSDGSRIICSPSENSGLFAATIGGLGLTGVILNASLKMRRAEGLALETEDIRFNSLDDFFALARGSETDWEYTAAWVDCASSEANLGRGIFSRARHAPHAATEPPSRSTRFSMPFTPPVSLVNKISVRGFNNLYWRKLGPAGRKRGIGGYEPVFYPLDSIGMWNRLYGLKGFYQFQCVVPLQVSQDVIAELLRAIAQSGQGSMLAVLKTFGPLRSPGLLSFPMEGTTFALDFPNLGHQTVLLLRRLEDIVIAAKGRLYPAKDSLMSAESFRAGYPELDTFLAFRDPAISSAFARRVGIATS
jgi:FAD/FMN-containing dehydrogenase